MAQLVTRFWCWGNNDVGELGDGSTDNHRLAPVRVAGTGTWASITAGGFDHSCGIKTDGTACCWGDNSDDDGDWSSGDLGDGTTTDRPTPVQVVGTGTWTEVTAGYYHSCGLKTDGTAWCWGDNNAGQLGNAAAPYSLSPTQIASTRTWSTLNASGWHSCGIKTDGTAWCWGDNSAGELGDGTTTERTTPNQVAGTGTWNGISAGTQLSCGTHSDGTAWCWGRNSYGELGDGTTTNSSLPVHVVS